MLARHVGVSILLSVYAFGCAECAPGRVSEGVSRLTIRNTAAIATLINDDQNCGFESSAVKNAAMISGSGADGSATWSVDQCTIDLSTPKVETDCNGSTQTLSGRVTVTAKRTINGTLTGDVDNPVIPGGPDAVTLELTKIVFDHFKVEVSDNDAALTQLDGALSATLHPRLAVAKDIGVCSIPTKHVTFENVAYDNANVHVVGDGHDFDVPVPISALTAVSNENSLSGTMTVWSSSETIAPDDGLDPDYGADKFASSFACNEGLELPLSFDCEGAVAPRLAQGAARLSIRNFGKLADRLDKDTSCGFASTAVLSSPALDAPVGSIGSATFTVQNCTLDFGIGTVVATDCEGNETKVFGKATVSGTKHVSGRLTGDLREPVVPMSDEPAEVELTITALDGFAVEEDGTSLTWISGTAHGHVHPRVAADTSKKGACGFETPIARFDFSYDTPAEVKLHSSSGSFTATIDGGHLTALNGNWGPDVNQLSGMITFNGETFAADTEGLDPEFDQAAFDRSWQCGTLEQPVRFDCNFVAPIARGASQLTVQLFGKMTEMIEADASCGFASSSVIDAAAISGELAHPGGSAVFTINDCALTFADRTVFKTDCNGKKVYVSGTAHISGTKTLRGYVSGDPLEPIVPTSRDPAEFDLHATFENFSVWSDPEINKLTIGSGGLSGKTRPRLGIDESTGACSIPYGVAELDQLTYHDANVRVESEGKVFDVRLASSMLHAINGSRDSMTNNIDGLINVDGVDQQINGALDPDYDQSVFDKSHQCIQNLRVPAEESECNMKKTLGEGAARLLVLTLGSVAGLANSDTSCGYAARRVQANPSQVVGDVGQQGSLSWEITGCEIAPDPNTPIKTDCSGHDTTASGAFTFNGGRTVVGLRNEVTVLIILHFDSVIPTTRNAVTVRFDAINFNDFNLNDGDRGLRLRNGSMSAVVNPILGERVSVPGSYDVPTPVAHLSMIHAQDIDARILFKGKRFDVHIDGADLEAFNGSWVDSPLENYLAGSVTLEGQTTMIPPSGLDPDYDQAAFDQSYACTDDLVGVVPSNPAP